MFFICQQKCQNSVTQRNKKLIAKSSKGAKTTEPAVEYEKSTSTISTIFKEKDKNQRLSREVQYLILRNQNNFFNFQ